LLLGDIVLCLPKIKSQAEEYGHSTLREYAFLIAHSVLHLIGYDHMTEEDAEDMFRKQDEVLSELGITRE
jgi:probable rRNA maturation factor